MDLYSTPSTMFEEGSLNQAEQPSLMPLAGFKETCRSASTSTYPVYRQPYSDQSSIISSNHGPLQPQMPMFLPPSRTNSRASMLEIPSGVNSSIINGLPPSETQVAVPSVLDVHLSRVFNNRPSSALGNRLDLNNRHVLGESRPSSVIGNSFDNNRSSAFTDSSSRLDQSRPSSIILDESSRVSAPKLVFQDYQGDSRIAEGIPERSHSTFPDNVSDGRSSELNVTRYSSSYASDFTFTDGRHSSLTSREDHHLAALSESLAHHQEERPLSLVPDSSHVGYRKSNSTANPVTTSGDVGSSISAFEDFGNVSYLAGYQTDNSQNINYGNQINSYDRASDVENQLENITLLPSDLNTFTFRNSHHHNHSLSNTTNKFNNFGSFPSIENSRSALPVDYSHLSMYLLNRPSSFVSPYLENKLDTTRHHHHIHQQSTILDSRPDIIRQQLYLETRLEPSTNHLSDSLSPLASQFSYVETHRHPILPSLHALYHGSESVSPGSWRHMNGPPYQNLVTPTAKDSSVSVTSPLNSEQRCETNTSRTDGIAKSSHASSSPNCFPDENTFYRILNVTSPVNEANLSTQNRSHGDMEHSQTTDSFIARQREPLEAETSLIFERKFENNRIIPDNDYSEFNPEINFSRDPTGTFDEMQSKTTSRSPQHGPIEDHITTKECPQNSDGAHVTKISQNMVQTGEESQNQELTASSNHENHSEFPDDFHISLSENNSNDVPLISFADDNSAYITDCVVDKDEQRENALTLESRSHTSEPLIKCQISGEGFKDLKTFSDHRSKHCDELNFTCEVCGKNFRGKVNLQVHLATHSDDRPHVCQVCGWGFKIRNNLIKHMTTHTADAIHICKYCQQRFPDRPCLDAHLVIHEKSEMYTCDVCQQTFTHQSYLKKHAKRHTNLKPHGCMYCDKRFRGARQLREHVATHTGNGKYVCNVCGKKCAQKGQLNKHMLTHTGEKPYKCHICDRRFRHSYSFKIHLNTHTHKYRCIVCNVECDDRAKLKEHVKNIHKISTTEPHGVQTETSEGSLLTESYGIDQQLKTKKKKVPTATLR